MSSYQLLSIKVTLSPLPTAYYDIRFDKQPKLPKIKAALEQGVNQTKSVRAAITLAEFNAEQKTQASLE